MASVKTKCNTTTHNRNLLFLFPMGGAQSQGSPVRRSWAVLSKGPLEIPVLWTGTCHGYPGRAAKFPSPSGRPWQSFSLDLNSAVEKSQRREDWKSLKLCCMRFYLPMLESVFFFSLPMSFSVVFIRECISGVLCSCSF